MSFVYYTILIISFPSGIQMISCVFKLKGIHFYRKKKILPVCFLYKSKLKYFSTYISTNSGNEASGGVYQDESKNLAQHLPRFIWAVRDHHLKLEIDEKAVTADEYFEYCLKFKAGNSKAITEYNSIREAIRYQHSDG